MSGSFILNAAHLWSTPRRSRGYDRRPVANGLPDVLDLESFKRRALAVKVHDRIACDELQPTQEEEQMAE